MRHGVEGDILQHRNENWLGIIKFSKEKNKYMIGRA